MNTQEKIMNRICLATATAALAALAACGPANRSFDTVKAPVVTSSQMAYDVPSAGSSIDARALNGWLASIRLGYGDRVSIDDPNGYGSAERRAAIAEAVGRHGLLLDGTTPITMGNVPSGSVRVVVTRSRARVNNCPDWERISQPELEASTMSNFGCATESNLAAMIADPNDLVTGKPYAGSDANTAVKAVDTWRKAQPTGANGLSKADIKQGSN